MYPNRAVGLTPGAQRTVACCRQMAAQLRDTDAWAGHLVLALLRDESLASTCLIQLGITQQWLITGALGPQVAESAVRSSDPAANEHGPDDVCSAGPNPTDALNDPAGFTEILDRASSIARRSDAEGGVTSGHLLLAVAEVSRFVQECFAKLSVTAVTIRESLNPVPPEEWTAVTLDEELRLTHDSDSPPRNETATADTRSVAWRIIDANLNRTREGLRVLEDFARFAANNDRITGELKSLRHDLVTTAHLLTGTTSDAVTASHESLHHRDTIGDVGTELSTPNERHRASLVDVVIANCRRVQESLRSLEEFGKLLSAEFAAGCKQLRYRAYTVEKLLGEVVLAAGQNANPLISRRAGIGHLRPLEGEQGTIGLLPRVSRVFRNGNASRLVRLQAAHVYVLISESMCRLPWKLVVEQALQGGADVLQLREKTLNDRELLRRARWMRDACLNANALFIVNDRAEIAVASEADGVHLGQEELAAADARRILLPGQLLGVSTHNPDQVQQAFAEGADMIGVGPVFPSPTKSFDEFPGLQFVQSVAAATSQPWFAIGGISFDNLAAVISAGASRIAVASCVAGSEDPAGTVGELKWLLQEKTTEPL